MLLGEETNVMNVYALLGMGFNVMLAEDSAKTDTHRPYLRPDIIVAELASADNDPCLACSLSDAIPGPVAFLEYRQPWRQPA